VVGKLGLGFEPTALELPSITEFASDKDSFIIQDSGTVIHPPEQYVLEPGYPHCDPSETMFAIFHHNVRTTFLIGREKIGLNFFPISSFGLMMK